MNKTKQRGSLFLMANLGSEISRVFSSWRKGNKELLETSVNRSNKIIDDLLADEQMKKRASEILILRDVMDDLVKNNLANYRINEAQLQSYFIPFALRVMSK